MFGKKRAQVTVFIIIGVILILAVILFLVLRGATVQTEIPAQIVSEEQAPLRDYVEACLMPNLLDGLELQRIQGGYIEIPEDVETLEINGNQVPYWLIEDQINIPTLEKMQSDLQNYILPKFLECVGDFEAFEDQGYVIEAGTPKLKITMANAVIAELDYPVILRKPPEEVILDQFIFSIPINFEQVYQTAIELAAFEGIYNYLEEHTMELVSKYGYAGTKTAYSLPPIAHYEYSDDGCQYNSWTKSEVENMLKENIHANIPYLKFENTNFERVVRTDPIEQGVFDSFIYNFFQEDKSNIQIDLSYETEWDMNFDILPRAGELIKPDTDTMTGLDELSGFCRMKYYFKYDIRYPVLYSINELNSAKIDPVSNTYETEQGYNLQFVIQTFVCGNQKRRCTAPPNFINNLQALANLGPEISQYYIAPTPSYFCDEAQKISDEVTIRVINKNTDEPIPNAMVSYTCGSIENDCLIGSTNENGILTSKFPYCVNGQLLINTEDFDQEKQILTIPSITTINIELNPHKEIALVTKKVLIDDLLEHYYQTNGFTIDRCTNEPVSLEIPTIEPLITDQIMISTKDGKINAIVPPDETIFIGSREYEFILTTSQIMTINPSVIQGKTIGYGGSEDSVTTSVPITVELEVEIENTQNSNKITFYMPIEYLPNTEIEITDYIDSAIQDDGSMSKIIQTNDCNENPISVEVTIPKQNVDEILKPKLE